MDLAKEGYGIEDPQQVIALSSMMTYKKENAKQMAIEILESEENLDETILKSLINSAGRGHASLSTSAGLWILFTNSSKFVDSLFTSAIFSSSLMPSGRRIGVSLENIIAPASIANADEKIKESYHRSSSGNIKLYEELLEKGISKDEASKILQYGMKGGGFIFLPLETILSYKEEFEAEKKWVPDEGIGFINQIEEKLNELGMNILYHARDLAPRNIYPNPNIFKDPERQTIVSSFQPIDKNTELLSLDLPFFDSQMYRNLQDNLIYLKAKTNSILSDPERIKRSWKDLSRSRRNITKEFQYAVSCSMFSNIAWRVWGELKRHRTIPQQVESI
jgi:hypothetical protein